MNPDVLDDVIAKARNLQEAVRGKRKERDLGGLYKATQKECAAMFDAQLKIVLPAAKSVLKESKLQEAPRSVSDKVERAWKQAEKKGKRLIKAIDTNGKKAAERGGKSGMKDLGAAQMSIDWTLQDKDVQKFLKNNGAKKVAGINKTTRDRLRRLIARAVKEGWAPKQLDASIKALFKGSERVVSGKVMARSKLIAITEMGEAYEAGRISALEKYQKAGVKTQKQWIAANDERVCSICAPNAAADWVAGEKNFPSGHYAPLGHPACRCDLTFRVV